MMHSDSNHELLVVVVVVVEYYVPAYQRHRAKPRHYRLPQGQPLHCHLGGCGAHYQAALGLWQR
jgi:hypothetical protein